MEKRIYVSAARPIPSGLLHACRKHGIDAEVADSERMRGNVLKASAPLPAELVEDYELFDWTMLVECAAAGPVFYSHYGYAFLYDMGGGVWSIVEWPGSLLRFDPKIMDEEAIYDSKEEALKELRDAAEEYEWSEVDLVAIYRKHLGM